MSRIIAIVPTSSDRRLETIAAIRQGLEDMKNGRTRPAEEVFEEIRQKYGIPG